MLALLPLCTSLHLCPNNCDKSLLYLRVNCSRYDCLFAVYATLYLLSVRVKVPGSVLLIYFSAGITMRTYPRLYRVSCSRYYSRFAADATPYILPVRATVTGGVVFIYFGGGITVRVRVYPLLCRMNCSRYS